MPWWSMSTDNPRRETVSLLDGRCDEIVRTNLRLAAVVQRSSISFRRWRFAPTSITYVALQLVELSGQLLDSRRQLLDDDSDLLHGTVAALRPTSALLALDSIPVIAIARLLSRSPWIPFHAMPGVATKERGPALVSKQMA
jgi:hypothetical protein